MSIEHEDFAWPLGMWDVKVWHDAELDYQDPDLTEQEVLAQIVAEGTFDIAFAEEIMWDDDVHVDPEDGTVTTTFATTFIAAGTFIGQTGQDKPALATIMRIEVSDSSGMEQMIFSVALIDLPETLEAAIDSAVEIWSATMAAASDPGENPGGGSGPGDGGGGDGGGGPGTTPPPNRDPITQYCPPTDGSDPPMSEECCACHTALSNSISTCRSNYDSDVTSCLIDFGINWGEKTAVCGIICYIAVTPPQIAACVACLAFGTGRMIKNITSCISAAARARDACIANANALFDLCAAIHCD